VTGVQTCALPISQQIDASLPDTTNTILSTSADESRLIVEASSSLRPLHYFLLDRTVPRLVSLGAARAFPPGAQFAPSDFFEFVARDGVKMSGRIHRPANARGAMPLIVLSGSDFNRRSYNGFKPVVQLLASRGYAVIEVNHRGVDGFGEKFAALGNETIDTAMADDLADAAREAVTRGWTAPGRIALWGESNGGVLALYALARNPDTFAVWLNYNTPMTRAAFWLDELEFGTDRPAARYRPLKEESRLRDYRAKLDPLATAQRIRVRSFHFYPGASLIRRDGFGLKKLLARSGVPHRFVEGLATQKLANDLEDRARQNHEERVRFFSEMFVFLAENLPPHR
jgi:acetyl esterase/lipase